jgi:hypothetical protein
MYLRVGLRLRTDSVRLSRWHLWALDFGKPRANLCLFVFILVPETASPPLWNIMKLKYSIFSQLPARAWDWAWNEAEEARSREGDIRKVKNSRSQTSNNFCIYLLTPTLLYILLLVLTLHLINGFWLCMEESSWSSGSNISYHSTIVLAMGPGNPPSGFGPL